MRKTIAEVRKIVMYVKSSEAIPLIPYHETTPKEIWIIFPKHRFNFHETQIQILRTPRKFLRNPDLISCPDLIRNSDLIHLQKSSAKICCINSPRFNRLGQKGTKTH